MKFSVIILTLVASALGAPDKLPVARQQKQLQTLYGSPSEEAPAGYLPPGDDYDDDLASYNENADDLSVYSEEGLDAQPSELDESLAAAEEADPIDMLMKAVPGIPGEDYPIFAEAPETSFTCEGKVSGGYYADPEAECQVFSVCSDDGLGGLTQNKFLCPNGTIFNQNYLICDWWFNFDCSEAEALAEEVNAALSAAMLEASARLAEEAELDTSASESVGSGYLAADASAPVEDTALPTYSEEELSSYGSY